MFEIGDLVSYNGLTGFVTRLDKYKVWIKWFTITPEYPYRRFPFSEGCEIRKIS